MPPTLPLPGGWLEGDLDLMSSCHEGHGDSQWLSVPLDDTVGLVRIVVRVQTDSDPVTLPITFEAGILRFSCFGSLGSGYGRLKGLS